MPESRGLVYNKKQIFATTDLKWKLLFYSR